MVFYWFLGLTFKWLNAIAFNSILIFIFIFKFCFVSIALASNQFVAQQCFPFISIDFVPPQS